ncbi:MAG TPA: peptidase S16, partial [Alphaproteobacteria bacterium]|nr:peptidase S16 [Alphaproteobacteria bacterium]
MFNDLNIKKDNLPLTLPIFPLSGALLLPNIELPLNIFEQKYIKMVDDALAEKKLIGLVQPQHNLIAKISKNKPLYKVGCVGKIRAFNETDDGRYLIVLSGVCRFTLGEEVATMRGYRRFKVDYSSFENDFEVRSEKNIFKLEIERKELFSKINSYLEKNSIDASLNNIS